MPIRFLDNFSRGFLYPFQASRFIFRHPGLVRYILIPFVINLLVFSLAVYLGIDFFNDTVIHAIPRGDAWYWALLYYFIWLVAVVVTAVLVFFSFTVIGNLIASPFNDILSERTEDILSGGSSGEVFSLKAFFRDARRTLAEEIKKISVFVLGMVLLLLLNFLPVLGTFLYSVLSILFTLFFLVVEYTGFVFGRKRKTFREQRLFILSRKGLMLGFGTGVLALLAVPFLQFFCIPASVVGATRLWHETISHSEEGFK